MRLLSAALILALLGIASRSPAADEPAVQRRLAQALELFPDADPDKDGNLTLQEALKYAPAHPELRARLAARKGGGKGGARVSSSGPSASPSRPDLSPGPRVFVCAHSFMIYTATLLPPLAEAAGIGWQGAGRQMIGGSRVSLHWEVPDEDNEAKKALREGRVDVLTLSPHLLLPDEGIDRFTRLGLEKNPKLRVLVQASWPAMDGELGGGFTNEKRNAATVASLQKLRENQRELWLKPLEKQVRALNTAVGREAVYIVPVYDAVFALRERLAQGAVPGLSQQTDLFRDSLGHPKPPLAALVTYCHFASIFKRNPAGLPVPAELQSIPQAEELNRLLQQLAWEAVSRYPLGGVKTSAQ